MKTTRGFFDEYALEFESLYGMPKSILNRIVNPLFRKSMKLRFEKTITYASPIEGKRVLDVGCGPGHYSVALARKGARFVQGIDFSENMIKLAQNRAMSENVSSNCAFDVRDFFQYSVEDKFDYTILMGFMDYMEDPSAVLEKTKSLTKDKAFFSFPSDGGLLAFQRKLRYKSRCPLFMYSTENIKNLFSSFKDTEYKIEQIHRDFFVTWQVS